MSNSREKWTLKRLIPFGLGLLVLVGVVVCITLVVDHKFHHHGEEEHAHGGRGHQEKGHEGARKEGRVKLTPEALRNADLEILTAGPGKVEVTLPLSGELAVNADRLAHVSPRVGGTVKEVKKQLGDVVAKGDILAVLESRDLAEMQREASTAHEKLKLAEANFKRQQMLFTEKISAEKDYLASKQALAEAQIEARSSGQKLIASGGTGPKTGVSGYALVAPLDGTIIEKHVSVGEVMKDDTQAFTIADLSSLWVNVTVYAKDLAAVREGQRAVVRAEGITEPARGTIGFLGQVVTDQSRSATARVVIDNPGSAWRPGLFATAQVVVAEVDAAVVVSAESVQTVEGKEVVFVEREGGFQASPVRLGRRGTASGQAADLQEVLAGVKAGDRCVGKNSFILKAELGKSEAGHAH